MPNICEKYNLFRSLNKIFVHFHKHNSY